ncbi:hydroxyectoine utilization dehydratase EutB [Pseudomonas sp. MH9.2]|uniref:hydroxyectoine utilization dehydratase EutB n=1 Tax=unclassified Pseudomonas TaxID=196821 RepID=UPI002AC89BC5|nr:MULTISPECIES: hydroxyectoine utilization dehydratase EutB [unclassified Pseudomonas]MEB0005860.1 hydroxyectoine utilization dehydratase EutB [Pseudomonas sp. RTB2]MEB0017046.1 hydroxyectoine utilization dehydratase EutB [Pseudomonas sp. RTB3]MEB0026636.1 hydroxyectoine utilization dehydratase EutB [Pseudomonas sp. MH9.2]MEB0147551.1 hydroxyectoine utilization dehydratase EutB [Pseudomonas sp. CCC2.2]MEB0272022.1 hydroxyectoine utilization dehydratase EutB [Pseudomonas sp. 5B4]
MPELQLNDIYLARQRIQTLICRTPLDYSPSLSRLIGVAVYLKLESQQITGSFKLRGASNAVAQLSAKDKTRGVVAASTGNHGRALAYAASQLGVKATICLSHLVPANKVQAIRELGAEVRVVGQSQDDAQREAERISIEQGAALLPPFDHPAIIAGQGTLGLEILEQQPDVAQVLVPLSGGGLFAGVALALKSVNPNIRLYGISMQRGAAMHASLEAGQPVETEELPTLADSLGGGIGLDNRYTFAMTRQLCDQVHLLSEASIANGIRHAYREERQVVEGAAAVGIAALLDGLIEPHGPIVVVVSGRNVDIEQHLRVLAGADA